MNIDWNLFGEQVGLDCYPKAVVIVISFDDQTTEKNLSVKSNSTEKAIYCFQSDTILA